MDLARPGTDLQPLFELIVNTIPLAQGDPDGPLQILVTNLDYSDYLGRLAIARVFNGTLKTGQEVAVSKRDVSLQTVKITKLFSFDGLKRTDTTETTLGDIVAIAGVPGHHHRRNASPTSRIPRRSRSSPSTSPPSPSSSPSTTRPSPAAKASSSPRAISASASTRSSSPTSPSASKTPARPTRSRSSAAASSSSPCSSR